MCFVLRSPMLLYRNQKKGILVQRILSNWQFGLSIFSIALLLKPRRSHRYACVCEAALLKKYPAPNYPKLNFHCTSVCRNEGMMVKVKVDVTKIVKYVCVTGISIVAIIFGAKCLRAYLQDEA